MKILWAIAIALFQISCGSTTCLGQDDEHSLDTLLHQFFIPDGPGGVALVAKDGEIIYKKAFGKADLELDVPMRTEHVFRIGSITKQFTAVAILKLQEEGKLSVHDDMTKYIEDYPTQGHLITIEHLLTHTSGIKNYTSMDNFTKEVKLQDRTPGELIDFFKNEPMDFPPGTDYRYSNSGYILLGYIIERVSGKSYAQYIQDNFLTPLGMQGSFYDNSSQIIPNRIEGYQKKATQYEHSDYLSMTLPYAAGSLLSDVDGLFKWYQGLFQGKVLEMDKLEMAHVAYRLANGRTIDYGYGWRLGNIQDRVAIKHGGLVNGFASFAVYLPEERIFVALFSNCDCNQNLEYPASKMAAIVLGKPYRYKRLELSAKELRTYAGVYSARYYDDQKVVSFENDQLVYFSKGGTKVPLQAYTRDKFYIAHSLATLDFERSAKGVIQGFQLKSTDQPTVWDRSGQETETFRVITISEQTLDKYVGRYQFSPGPIFTIVKEGKKLYGQVGQDKKEILPYAANKFFAREIDARIIFNLDRSGEVIGLTKIQSSEMQAKKID